MASTSRKTRTATLFNATSLLKLLGSSELLGFPGAELGEERPRDSGDFEELRETEEPRNC
jgi:hypothetical protein